MHPESILLIRDGRLGDLLMITPVLRALRLQWPGVRIELLTNTYGARVLERSPYLYAVHVYERERGMLAQLRRLQGLPGPYDLLLSLEGSSYFAQVSRVTPARLRVGFSNVMAWLYDRHLAWDPDRHAILNNLALARLAGVEERHCEPWMELKLPEEDLELAGIHLAGEGLGPDERFVFLHPPCGPEDPLRPWPAFYYAELADRLQSELGCRVLINGSPDEAHIVDTVMAQSSTPVLTNTDPSLGLMMALIARSALFVGGDTGPLYMAEALQRPRLGLFGTTVPVGAASPDGSGHTRFLSAEFPCSPCATIDSPEKQACLKRGIADCMVAITVDRVLEECRALLEED